MVVTSMPAFLNGKRSTSIRFGIRHHCAILAEFTAEELPRVFVSLPAMLGVVRLHRPEHP